MPKPGPRTTYKYSEASKATAVRLSKLLDVEVQDVAASLYIHPFMLSRWRKEAHEGKTVSKDVKIDRETAKAAMVVKCGFVSPVIATNRTLSRQARSIERELTRTWE